jgi:endo-1,4-beta-xylanase
MSLRGADESKVVWNNPATFSEPGLSHHHFSSAAMNRKIGYCVWLPPGYEASTDRLPVIYFLHGTGGTESADAPGFSHALALRLAAGAIPPVIAVFPNGGVSGYRDHVETGINVETMLVRELIPLIDETYRTRPDRDSRVITGFSMGGDGAVRLALKYPGQFSTAASWAGAFVRRDEHGGFVPEFEIFHGDTPNDPVRLLLIVGYDDLTYPWHAHAIDILQRSTYPFTLHLIDHLAHDLGRYYELTSDELIAFLTKDFPRPPKTS